MRLKPTLVSKRKHFIVYPTGITYTQYTNSSVYQFFTDPVDSHITLCTNQNLIFTMQRFVNSFHQRSSLSCSGRSMYNCYIFSMQYFINSLILCSIQPRKTDRLKRINRSLPASMKQISQLRQPVIFCSNNLLQSLKHGSIAGFVKI